MKICVFLLGCSLFASTALAQPQTKVVKLASTTPAEQKAILAQVGDGTLNQIEHVVDKGEITFDVDMTTKDGEDRDFTIAWDGTLMSVEVSLKDTPDAVQRAIRSQLGTGKLDTIEKSIDDDEISYDVTSIAKDGQDRSFTVSDSGKLLSLEITLAEAPTLVQKAIASEVGQNQLGNIEKNLEDGDVTYQVSFTNKAGLPRSFTLGDEGKVESREIALEDAPPAVQQTVATEVGKGKVQDVDEIIDSDGITYEIGMTVNANGGRYRDFTVAADGHLDSREVALANAPAPVRAAIAAQIGNGKVLSIEQSFVEKEAGVFPYQVTAEKDGKPFDFSVGPKGRFLGMDD